MALLWDHQLCSSASQLKHSWAAQLLGVVINPFGQMVPKGTFHHGERWTYHLAWALENWAVGSAKLLV